MSIRPIDMQVLIPRSQNISNINQNILNKNDNTMQQAYNNNKVITEKKIKQVNTLNKKEHSSIRNKSEERKHNHNQNNNNKHKDEEKKQEINHLQNMYKNKIDIKI